jgi:hypothetical protein
LHLFFLILFAILPSRPGSRDGAQSKIKVRLAGSRRFWKVLDGSGGFGRLCVLVVPVKFCCAGCGVSILSIEFLLPILSYLILPFPFYPIHLNMSYLVLYHPISSYLVLSHPFYSIYLDLPILSLRDTRRNPDLTLKKTANSRFYTADPTPHIMQ